MNLRLLIVPCAAALLGVSGNLAAAPETAPAQQLYDTLVRTMKDGSSLGFSGRVKALDPEVRRDYDLALMTRLIVGPAWRTLKPEEQRDLVEAFSEYSVAQYASQFTSYDGERFVVNPAPAPLAGGDAEVITQLIPHGGDAVQLNYRVRNDGGSWRIIDVYLNGTISELAARRSEYSGVLRSQGPAALAKLLRQKAAQLGS